MRYTLHDASYFIPVVYSFLVMRSRDQMSVTESYRYNYF